MELNELESALERELTYPVDARTVRDQLGDVSIDAPDAEDSEAIRTLLLDDDVTYSSATELFHAITGQLPEEYVGRKYYDDRGSNMGRGKGPEDDRDQSF